MPGNPFVPVWLIPDGAEVRSRGLARARRHSCSLVGVAGVDPAAARCAHLSGAAPTPVGGDGQLRGRRQRRIATTLALILEGRWRSRMRRSPRTSSRSAISGSRGAVSRARRAEGGDERHRGTRGCCYTPGAAELTGCRARLVRHSASASFSCRPSSVISHPRPRFRSSVSYTDSAPRAFETVVATTVARIRGRTIR